LSESDARLRAKMNAETGKDAAECKPVLEHGNTVATEWTCDFSCDQIKINAE